MNVSRPDRAAEPAPLRPSPLTRHLLGLTAYHLVLIAGAFWLWTTFPSIPRLLTPGAFREPGHARSSLFEGARASVPGAVAMLSDGERFTKLGLATALAILGALAITVPVAWLYVLTRRRKGFTQSVVHTLLILPITVAGVVTLVQDSLALAFSLAGIVAAVRFRNTLEDTKDAVYIFTVTGIGIAAGVGDIVIGLVMAILFNAVVLVLWWTEFGRAPARLEGSPAVRSLERARQLADQGGEFVTTLDKEVLANLSPVQLESLAARAWRRRQLKDDGPVADRRFPFDAVLRLHATDQEPVQLAAESLLLEQAKRWELSAIVPDDKGRVVLEYLLKLRKSVDRNAFLAALRARSGPSLFGVELR